MVQCFQILFDTKHRREREEVDEMINLLVVKFKEILARNAVDQQSLMIPSATFFGVFYTPSFVYAVVDIIYDLANDEPLQTTLDGRYVVLTCSLRQFCRYTVLLVSKFRGMW